MISLIIYRLREAMCNKSDREHVHARSACLQERGSTGIRCRAGGHDIIDQQNALTAHRISAAAANAESIRHIMLACILSEANLRPGSLRSLEGRDGSGDARCPAQALGQKGGLVEAPLQKPEAMKRNRDKNIGISKKAAPGLAHQLYEQRQRLMLVLELEAHNETADDASIMGSGSRPQKYGRVRQRLH
jgi:hypothetical protein